MVAFDGTGRYRYERTTSAGLREQVVCDGTSLWHIYPELGIGARRTLSRFHRRSLRGSCLGPCLRWKTWPAALTLCTSMSGLWPSCRRNSKDRLKAGLRALRSTAFRRNSSAIRSLVDGDHGKPSQSLRTHLVFAPDGRLAERQLVEMPSGKILARESYGADGTVEFVAYKKKDAGGTPAPQRKILLAPCGAPELKPSADLVVLPLPLRSRQQVLGTRKLLADGDLRQLERGRRPGCHRRRSGRQSGRNEADHRPAVLPPRRPPPGILHPSAQQRADVEPQGKAGFPGRRAALARSAGGPSQRSASQVRGRVSFHVAARWAQGSR